MDAEIVVVGGGIAGVATARALARAGRSVTLLEQFTLGHERGSSHGSSRIFRLNYPDERFVRLAQGALEAWRELEAESSETLLVRTGALDIGPEALENARALSACGAPHELLTGAAASERWPIRATSTEHALFQPDGGITLAERAHAAFVAGARAAGATILQETAVRGLTRERASIRVTTDRGDLTARAVVATAGPWAPALVGPVEIELPVIATRETVAYLELPAAETVPPLIDYARLPEPGAAGLQRAGQAAFGLSAPGVGLKVGLHHSGPATDPDELCAPDAAIVDWATRWAAGRYVGVGALSGSETCIYTNTADESFVLERHGRVVVGSACSGHGFKFAPVLGRALAALAIEAAR